MNLSKKMFLNKVVIFFVAFVFVFQPFLVLAEEILPVGSTPIVEESAVVSAPTGDDSGGDVFVETGDVDILLGVDNDTNQNDFSNDSKEESEPLVIEDINPSATDSGEDFLVNNNELNGDNSLNALGTSGDNIVEENGGAAIVDSGDININSNLDNNANKNAVDVLCFDCENKDATYSEFNIENNNDSDLENEVGIEADSGNNLIKDSGGDASINTGNIGIVNLIINFINANFVGNGKEFFINIFDKLNGSLDLSGYGDSSNEQKDFGVCSGSTCQLNINNNSTSTLDNIIDIDVNTGKNIIATTTGGGVIETGDIDIVNDILNIANLNVSGNGWFFAIVNIFGEMDGDVILPGFKLDENETLVQEEETLASEEFVKPEVSSEFILSNNNDGDLLNDINVNLNTGENEVFGNGSSFIESGDIESRIKTLNLVNYNIAGDFWKFARINVFGSWEGIINGLPSEYSYYEDENSIIIYNKFLEDPSLNESYAQMAIENYNTGTTTNEINIAANTGDNSILHQDEYGLIKTGYIKIKNSLLNFLNSNFAGNNWQFSMINVFGDWKGNLDFGQPELWINVSSSEKKTAKEGDLVTYTFIYGNNGDSTASDVVVVDDFNEQALEIAESGGGNESDGLVSWLLGDIPPNSQGSFSYTTQVKKLPAGNHTIRNDSRILSDQTDRNPSNNSSSVSFSASGVLLAEGVRTVSSSKSSLPSLSIVKTNNAVDIVRPGDVVEYKIIVKNNGSKNALEVYVLDVMKNIDTDEEIHRDFWNLETVFAGEEIVIEYSLEISRAIESGTYINEATVEAYDPDRKMYISAIGSSRNKVINDLEKEENLKPNLNLSRIYRSGFANPGDVVSYEVIIANNGRGDALNVKLVEALPEYLNYLDTTDSIREWVFDVIKIGEIKNIKLSASVSDLAKEGKYTGHLSLVGDNISSSSLSNEIEIREVQVLGDYLLVEDYQENKSEKRKIALLSALGGESNNQPVTTTIENSLSKGEGVLNSGQIFGIEDSNNSTPFYKIYLIVLFLALLLIFLLIWFFTAKDEDQEKLL